MISLSKLEQLPRHQRLRKITKIFAEAENRLATVLPQDAPPASLAGILSLLLQDSAFSDAAREALREARETLCLTPAQTGSAEAAEAAEAAETAVSSVEPLRRALNTVRHILLTETGRSQADWDFIGPGGSLDPARRRPFAGMQVYLEDIRSPFNVGAMFRTAESFGAEKLFLSPLCADPLHPRAERSAMGCVQVLPWERLAAEPFASAFEEAQGQPCRMSPGTIAVLPTELPLFALETGGIPLTEFPFPSRGLMIVGSEELGVSPRALAAADASLGRVTIPSFGAKGSLNASVAFGIAMQKWAESRNRR
jgi:TrmH family RNA methyltransferase